MNEAPAASPARWWTIPQARGLATLPMAGLPGGTSVAALETGTERGFWTGIRQAVYKRSAWAVRRGAACGFKWGNKKDLPQFDFLN